VPADLTEAGTVAARAVLVAWVGITVVGIGGAVVVVVAGAAVVVVVELLELLEHALATSATVPSITAAAVFILRVVVRTGDPPRSSR
jgi:hypothetical protein